MDNREDQIGRLARELSRTTALSFEAARYQLARLAASAERGAEIAGGLRRRTGRYPSPAWQRFTEPNRRRRRG